MFMIVCGAMLLAAVAANLSDRRMLALTATVGAVFFLPSPEEFDQFYIFCISAECLVAAIAYKIRAAGSLVVFEICVMLVAAHLMGYSLDGSPPFSPYRMIVKILEFSQITACFALSPLIAPILRNQNETIN